MEGLTAISQLEEIPEGEALLSEPELLEMQARLSLAGKTLGGLVTTEHLPEAYLKNRVQTEETRGHNWELLRQRAEANGLYFDPLGFARSRTHALLWIAREDVSPGEGQSRKWDGRFLGIADPFNDSRLKNWTGYTEKRYFDESGLPVRPRYSGSNIPRADPAGSLRAGVSESPTGAGGFSRHAQTQEPRDAAPGDRGCRHAACWGSPSSEIGRIWPVPWPGTLCARAMAIPTIARRA